WASSFVGDGVTAIAVDPLQETTLYSATDRGVLRSTDGGATFERLSAGLPGGVVSGLAIQPDAPSTVYASGGIAVFRADFVSCANDGTALCLGGGRFQVDVDWQRDAGDPTQKAQAVGASEASGYFWFTDPYSVELVVKILDGRSVNGFFWVFYGALTDRGYTITVTDRETGEVRTYANEPGQIMSRADTNAVAGGGGAGAPVNEADLLLTPSTRRKAAPAGACVADAVTLCLNGGRFLVGVGLPTSPTGPILAAPAVPLTPDSGAFAFKDPANLEVAVK